MLLGEKNAGLKNGIFLKAQSPKPEKKITALYETRRLSKRHVYQSLLAYGPALLKPLFPSIFPVAQ